MCFRPTDPSNLQAQQLIAWFGPALGELIEVDVSSESTSWEAQLAEMMGMGVEPAQLRLISGGKDYSSNAMVLRDVSFGNSTIHFQVRWETRQPYRAALLLLVWRSAEFQRALPAKNFKRESAWCCCETCPEESIELKLDCTDLTCVLDRQMASESW